MREIVIGISDFKVSDNASDVLITYGLGSCIAIAVYDHVAKVGGLLHFMLPDSNLDLNKAQQKPAMFADTGIPLLFKSCYSLGAEKKRIKVIMVGGASILDDDNFFRIGQKNITAAKKLFWRNNVLVDKEDTGGNYNRTVRLHVSTGKVFVKSAHDGFREML